MSLDQRNLQILKLLQQSGRITNQELAEKVALSPSACLARVKSLEEQGYIQGYRTKIELEKLGPVLMAFVEVTLNSHYPEDFQRFEDFLADKEEVVETFIVGAHFDYLLQVVVSDMTELRDLSNKMLESNLGIAKLNTIPVIQTSKGFSGYPLEKIARLSKSDN